MEIEENKKIERSCRFCGKRFCVFKSILSGKTNSSGNFCVRSCYNLHLKTIRGEEHKDYRKIVVNCSECLKEIKRTPARIRSYKDHFCDCVCKYKFMAKSYCGDKNPRLKGLGFKKDEFKKAKREFPKEKKWCSICGTEQNIHIHHILPRRILDDNTEQNLIPLCASCHRKVETIGNNLAKSMSDQVYAYRLFGFLINDKRILRSAFDNKQTI